MILVCLLQQVLVIKSILVTDDSPNHDWSYCSKEKSDIKIVMMVQKV